MVTSVANYQHNNMLTKPLVTSFAPKMFVTVNSADDPSRLLLNWSVNGKKTFALVFPLQDADTGCSVQAMYFDSLDRGST